MKVVRIRSAGMGVYVSAAVLAAIVGLTAAGVASAEPTLITVVPPEKATSTAPQASAPGPAKAKQARLRDDQKMVCRTEPAATGSRLGGHRICLTQFDWDELHRAARDQMNHAPEWDPSGK
jgi:hypothetical protein